MLLQTQEALRKALQAAKEVTEYAKERDAVARRLEAQVDNNVRYLVRSVYVCVNVLCLAGHKQRNTSFVGVITELYTQ